MNAPLRIREVRIWRLAVPMRMRFEHAAAQRATADPIVVRVTGQAPYDQFCGYGETLARHYVTGETSETVPADIVRLFVPRLLSFRAGCPADAVLQLEQLPLDLDGQCVQAARCAVELALLDLVGRVFRTSVADIAESLSLPGFGMPGCLNTARYSGIVVGRGAFKLSLLLRAQCWYGLRDFKLKVATDGWEKRLERVHRILGPAIRRGEATLRVDANSAWTLEQALAALPLLERCGVSVLEQPLARDDDEHLRRLDEATSLQLMADESLVSPDDGYRLAAQNAIGVFNIRIAKQGGLLPALRMARLALTHDLDVQLGCLVGETSLLSAAGLAFLQLCPQVRFVEGAYGRWLNKADVVRRPVQFRFGGRLAATKQPGLGVEVDEGMLDRLSVEPAKTIKL